MAIWQGFCCKFLGEYNSERSLKNRPTFAKVMNECIVAQFFFDSLCIFCAVFESKIIYASWLNGPQKYFANIKLYRLYNFSQRVRIARNAGRCTS